MGDLTRNIRIQYSRKSPAGAPRQPNRVLVLMRALVYVAATQCRSVYVDCVAMVTPLVLCCASLCTASEDDS